MNIENQVCSLEQAKELNRLGVIQNASAFYYHVEGATANIIYNPHRHGGYYISDICFSAFTVSELLKMLPFIIRYEHNDYFMSFEHSMKGYRVIYETNKLGLVFNLDDELDREKKALFSTFRSGKVAAQVLAEYLRMLLDSNSGVLPLEDVNKRLLNP